MRLQNTVVSIELTFHFLSRKTCDKIPSYVNLSICFTVLLHERGNYIGLTVAKAVVYAIDERSMDCIFEIAWFRRFLLPGRIVLKLGGNCPDIGGELSGANCLTFHTIVRLSCAK